MNEQENNNQKKSDIEVIIVQGNQKNQNKSGNQLKERNKTFSNIKSSIKIYQNQHPYVDENFSIEDNKNSRRIIKKRMSKIYEAKTPIFPSNTQKYLKQSISIHKPSYLHQIQYLPLWHYKTLIQPQYINPKGYYEVVIWKQGRIIKQIIDDYIEFDQQLNKPILHKDLQDQPWIHIMLKAWAKINGGYDKLYTCQPFKFVRTFSFPDWLILNPSLEDIQSFLQQLTKINKKNSYMIGKTKKFQEVGLYGFLPDCAGYVISGFIQQYGSIFIKIISYVGTVWNNKTYSKQSVLPQQMPELGINQFLMPYREFVNIFHLVYCTNNKYQKGQKVLYQSKYTLNIDARESKAKMLSFTVKSETDLSLNTFFPYSKSFDMSHRGQENSKFTSQYDIVPYCKVMVGIQTENTNPQASLVDSMVDYILNVQDDDFLNAKKPVQFEWILTDYFKGYANELTYLLHLKPGRYFLRYKLQQIKAEYRFIVSTVSTQNIAISDPKMPKQQQSKFMKEVLASKARREKRNITYMNTITKKGSWIIFNNDFDNVGYASIIFHTVRNCQFKIVVEIDQKYKCKYLGNLRKMDIKLKVRRIKISSHWRQKKVLEKYQLLKKTQNMQDKKYGRQQEQLFTNFPANSDTLQKYVDIILYKILQIEQSDRRNIIIMYKNKQYSIAKKRYSSFYKDMKYKRISMPMIVQRSKKLINFQTIPFNNIDQNQINIIMERLNDSPIKIHEAIRNIKDQNKLRLKYTLLQDSPAITSNSSQNNKYKSLILKIKRQRRIYEQKYRQIFRNKKKFNENVSDLPKLGKIKQDRQTLFYHSLKF